MEKVILKVQNRSKAEKAKNLRKEGLIPAEYYGHGVANIDLQMNCNEFRRIFKTAGSNTVLDLEIEGGDTKKALVVRVDRDTVTNQISYVEFINVRMDEEVTTQLPVRLEGQAPAVRDLGGVLVQSLDSIEVSCLPGDLIHELVLNVESLVDFSCSLHVSDLVVPAKIKVLSDPEETIVSVSAPQEEEVAPEVAPTAADVEITTEKKETEGDDDEKKEKKGE
ncbi:MAG: 50S ribosomal protein L25 [Candidatus Gracilibacteria bacterium]